jgi:type II secretory ATPase GspE/PulE/Tfp pilus assembly ATPase PilB-like protein
MDPTNMDTANALLLFAAVSFFSASLLAISYVNKTDQTIAELRMEVAALSNFVVRHFEQEEEDDEEEEELVEEELEEEELEEEEEEQLDAEELDAEQLETDADDEQEVVAEQLLDESIDDESNEENDVSPPLSTTGDDKHTRLLAALPANSEVHITYKKQTWSAIFTPKEDSAHGYVFTANNETYNTPSHFSTHVKKQINPAIQADNGWDSIYIVTGTTKSGKPAKVSLNELINPPPVIA